MSRFFPLFANALAFFHEPCVSSGLTIASSFSFFFLSIAVFNHLLLINIPVHYKVIHVKRDLLLIKFLSITRLFMLKEISS